MYRGDGGGEHEQCPDDPAGAAAAAATGGRGGVPRARPWSEAGDAVMTPPRVGAAGGQYLRYGDVDAVDGESGERRQIAGDGVAYRGSRRPGGGGPGQRDAHIGVHVPGHDGRIDARQPAAGESSGRARVREDPVDAGGGAGGDHGDDLVADLQAAALAGTCCGERDRAGRAVLSHGPDHG
nr:hypothetical protein [Tomitella gaofuii]